MSDQDTLKRQAALAALEAVDSGWVVGVGTGSTTNHFIDALGALRPRIGGAVARAVAPPERLQRLGVRVLDLNDVGRLPLYVDGADEVTRGRELLKGGGGALTREKIVAAASDRFICIVDESKVVRRLGRFPLALEVIPMAVRLVGDEIARRGGRAVLRPDCTTDNGNRIVDVQGLSLARPRQVERELNDIPGVVSNGLFCLRPADELIIAGRVGVERIGRDGAVQRSGGE